MNSSRDLSLQDQRYISHAIGYLELGMVEDAMLSLDGVDPLARGMSPVLDIHLAILMQSRRWSEAVEIASRLVKMNPGNFEGVLHLAYSTRRAESIEAARKILLEAVKQFPEVALIHYNLGCYEAQLGNLEVATELVKKAIRMDESFQKVAVEDSDLEAIWEVLDANSSDLSLLD